VRVRSVWLLALASLTLGWPGVSLAALPKTGSIEQHSEGACSPPIINNEGHVSISCPGIAPEALHYLENQLSDQFGRLNEQLRGLNDTQRTIRNLNDLVDNLHKQADDWAQRYHDLSGRLVESGNDSGQAKQAHDLIQRGEFATAEALLQAIAATQEGDVTGAAATQYDLGDLAMLRFDAQSALPHYEKAFRYRPENPRYADGYARAAYTERNYAKAERGWTAALQLNRDLAAHDPGAYRPDVAQTLNNLGVLYSDTGRLADADKAYSEALTIHRDLAAHDPGAYRPDVAGTLNNLGILYSDTGRLADADKACNEALTIYRDLAARDPGAYRPDVARTLNNLGILYRKTGRLADADKASNEALTIYRDLAARDPGAYRPDVADALSNLGNLYRDAGRLADADKAYSEVLTIYRDLASSNPTDASKIASLIKLLSAIRTKSSTPSLGNPWVRSIGAALVIGLVSIWVKRRREALFSIGVSTIIFAFGNILEPATKSVVEEPFTYRWVFSEYVRYFISASSFFSLVVAGFVPGTITGLLIIKARSFRQRLVYGAFLAVLSLTLSDAALYYPLFRIDNAPTSHLAIWTNMYFSLVCDLFGGAIGGIIIGSLLHLFVTRTTKRGTAETEATLARIQS
jgi:tetratricopeptide (TPR) repeat protein